MSRGMLLLVSLFAATPLAAQPPESAPMPRARTGKYAVELQFDLTSRGAGLGIGVARTQTPALLPPVGEGVPTPLCEEPPSDAEVLKAMPAAARGVPHVCEICRDGITIVKERVVDRIDAPRFFPLVGIAQKHHCQWKCTVAFTETMESGYPFAIRVAKPRTEVIYIDRDFLHAVADTANPQPMAAPRCSVDDATCANLSAPARLTGTWYREMPGIVVSFTFAGDELTMKFAANENGQAALATLTADCAVTKDGTVHGVFTGADVRVAGKPDITGLELAEMTSMVQSMVDQPFAFRCRSSDGGLMLSNVRLPDPHGAWKESMAMMCGKYTTAGAKGAVPTPKSVAALPMIGRCEASACPVDLPYPSGPSVLPLAQASGPPIYPSPYYAGEPPYPFPCVAPPAPSYSAPIPSSPPPEVQTMMMQALGQMMSGPHAIPAAYMPPPPMPAPSAWAAPTPVRLPNTLPVGNWTRDIGPVQYKLEIRENHLFITVSITEQEDGNSVRIDHILTADCYATRNAGEVVGVITGFDMTAAGQSLKLDDVMSLLKELPGIQKQLTGKPLALTFRLYDDTLVVGDVRAPSIKGEQEELSSMFTAMAGKYKVSSSALPPRPVVLTPASVGGVTLSSPRCLEVPPRCTSAEPVPLERIGIDFNFNPPKRYGMPPMPPPPALPESAPAKKPNPFRNGGM